MCQGTIEKTKYNCHDKFANVDPVVGSRAMTPNGSVVWFVAVCPGVARFLPIQVDGAEVMSHGDLCKLLCKNRDT